MTRSIRAWLARARAHAAQYGIAGSLALHLLAATAVAFSPWLMSRQEPFAEMEFAGRKGVVQIEASYLMPLPTLDVIETPRFEAPVVVTPREARIEHRLYVQSLPMSSDFAGELPELALDSADALSELKPSRSRAESSAQLPPWNATSATPATIAKAPSAPPQVSSAAAPLSGGSAGFETAASFAGNAPPLYPAIAVQNGWSGRVLLKLWIDETGAVTSVAVERSSGHAVLDAAAVNAVRRWRGQAKRIAGHAVSTAELQEINFRLPQ